MTPKTHKSWKYFGKFDKLHVSGIMRPQCLNKLESHPGVRHKGIKRIILTCYPYNSETRLMFNAYRARSTVTKMPDYPVSTEFGILCDDLQDITYIPNKRSITARSD